VTPADVKAVAAIEKLIGQTIAWTGAPALAEADDGKPARRREAAPRRSTPFGRQAARTPAPVAQLAQARPSRAPEPRQPEPRRQEPRRPEPAMTRICRRFCSAGAREGLTHASAV